MNEAQRAEWEKSLATYPVNDVLQALADAYATAAFAMGPTGLAWVAGVPDYEGCAITADPDGSNGRLAWTPGFDPYFADR